MPLLSCFTVFILLTFQWPAFGNRTRATHQQDAGGGKLSCVPGCKGTCDEVTGTCVCPPFKAGADCGLPAAPSCTIHPDYTVPCSWAIPKTCACARECEHAMRNPILFQEEPCFEFETEMGADGTWGGAAEANTSVEDAYRAAFLRSKVLRRSQHPARVGDDGVAACSHPARLVRQQARGDGAAIDNALCESDEEETGPMWGKGLLATAVLPLDRCPNSCSHHGMCIPDSVRAAEAEARHAQTHVPGREAWVDAATALVAKCECFYGWHGPDCGDSAPTARCLNNCNGRGNCVLGFCMCEGGFWGADCSVSMHNGAPTFVPKDGWQGDGAAESLTPDVKVFVYDLPPELNEWLHVFYRKEACDFGRPRARKLHERFLCSHYRTLDPDEADYFFVPAYGEAHQGRHAVINYLRDAYPQYYDREGRYPDHLMVIEHDHGAAVFFPETHIPDHVQARFIFVQHMGSTTTRSYEHAGTKTSPPFRLYQDILMPPTVPGPKALTHTSIYWKKQSFVGGAGVAHRPNVLFFSGYVYPDSASKYHAALPRNRVFTQFAGATNETFLLINTRVSGDDPHYWEHYAQSTFCLGLPGKGGGWGRRTHIAVMMGCIPVVIEDERAQMFDELLPWDSFSIRLPEKDIPMLFDLVALLSKDRARVEALQQELSCAARLMWWTTTEPPLGEDGRFDAFTALMGTLRRRLRLAGGWGVKNNPVSSACAAEEEAPLVPNMFPGGRGICGTTWEGLVPPDQYCTKCQDAKACPTCCMGKEGS